jgi:hypothetical protein
MASKLIQIVYKDEQKASCFPFAEIYFNHGLTIYFENEIISSLVPTTEAKNIAVASWKLQQKLKMYIGRPRPITAELLDSDYEVLSFTKNTKYHQMLANMDIHHKGSRQILGKILSLCSLKMPSEVKIPIYQNHHSSRTDIYQFYVKSYLKPVMDLMSNDKEINKLIMQDSNYSQLAKTSAVSPEYLMEKIGVPYYPIAPFLLERLFSIFVQNEKIKVTHL